MASIPNVLSREKRAAVVSALAEGCSIRSTVRLTVVAKNAVVKLLVDLGAVCKRAAIQGNPDPKHISTSYIERQNLTVRMSMCRFTKLTNAFSKKVENLAAAVSLHFMYYNFCRLHMTLKGRTPAQAARVTSRRWTAEDVVRLLEKAENPMS